MELEQQIMKELMINDRFAIAHITGANVNVRLFKHSAMAWINAAGNRRVMVIKTFDYDNSVPDQFNMTTHDTDTRSAVKAISEYFASCNVKCISQLDVSLF